IVIHPRRRHTPQLLAGGGESGNPGFFSYVGKGAVAIVVIQDIAVEACHIEISPAVVIIVGHGHANAVALATDAGAVSDVGESSVAIVVIEAVVKTGTILHHSGKV